MARFGALALALTWGGAGGARLTMKNQARAAAGNDDGADGGPAVAAAASPSPATAPEDERDVEKVQECVNAIRSDGPDRVKINFVTMDGEVNDKIVEQDLLAAGCFCDMALEAFNMYDDEGEEEDVQVLLNQGSSLRSQVNSDSLMRMLTFAHQKLVKADFQVKDVTFSSIEWPVKSDLTEAGVLPEDAEFIESVAADGKIFSLVIATHFMDFRELYRLCTAKVAGMIWGKTEEDIREALNKQG